MTNRIFSVADDPRAPDASPALLIRTSLDQARRLALGGATEAARRQCAETIAQWQVWIARDPALLQLAVACLLRARGFEMVRRLLAASRGWRVRFNLVESDLPSPDAGIAATAEQDGSTTYTLFSSVFDHPSGERLIEALSHRLVVGSTLPAVPPGVARLDRIQRRAAVS
jgi:hypothetical protein